MGFLGLIALSVSSVPVRPLVARSYFAILGAQSPKRVCASLLVAVCMTVRSKSVCDCGYHANNGADRECGSALIVNNFRFGFLTKLTHTSLPFTSPPSRLFHLPRRIKLSGINLDLNLLYDSTLLFINLLYSSLHPPPSFLSCIH